MGQTLIRAASIAKSYNWHDIFSGISFSINTNERTALVGPNGVGKSTLARILVGEEPTTAGTIQYLADNLVLGLLPQDSNLPLHGTPLSLLEDEVARLGAAAKCSVTEALGRCGFMTGEELVPVCKLSGGQKTRVALGRIWLSLPDLLILDEPTNHLDQEGMDWLERLIGSYPHSVLIISHDRYFLDQVANRILEMSSNGMTEYLGNYSAYRQQKQAAFAQQLHQYEGEQKEIRRIEEAIDRQMRWFKMAHDHAGEQSEIRMGVKEFYRAKAKRMAVRAKSTIKRLERMKTESVAKPKAENAISLDLSQEQRTGARIFLAEDLGIAFSRILFKDVSFAIMRGDKIGVIGPNGSGKTTLMRLLLGQLVPTWGKVWSSPSLKPGYLEQEMQNLKSEHSLVDSVLDLYPQQTAELKQRVRQLLAAFLFPYEAWGKPLSVLSEGERRRIALIRLLLGEYNVLLLDEPTNHLDLQARTKLEDAMCAYNGTMIVVAHDRYLIQKVCNKVLVIANEQVQLYPGTYNEYVSWRNAQRENSRAARGNHDTGRSTSTSLFQQMTQPQLSPREERLLLENRLAWLSAQLGARTHDPEKNQQIEAEFFAVSRALRGLH